MLKYKLNGPLFQSIHHHANVYMSGFSNISAYQSCDKLFKSFKHYKDTVLSDKAIDDVQDPLGVNGSLKPPQHVVIPDEHGARCRGGTRVGAHLALQRQCEVVGVAEVEVTGQIDILKNF